MAGDRNQVDRSVGALGNDVNIADPLGQHTMSGSVAVVIASDQTAIPVTGAFSITGGATSDNQTNGNQIVKANLQVGGAAVTTTNPVPVCPPLSGALPVSVSSLPLPSGASTETTLGSVKTAVESINTKMVSGTDIGDVTINNTSGAGAVNIQDGGNSITVDNAGTFAVQNTPVIPTAIYNGKTTVTTAGTRVALASSQAIRSVVVKALIANTGVIYVGNSTVASTNGIALNPGDTVSLEVANLATVYIDSSVNGEGVTYIAT